MSTKYVTSACAVLVIASVAVARDVTTFVIAPSGTGIQACHEIDLSGALVRTLGVGGAGVAVDSRRQLLYHTSTFDTRVTRYNWGPVISPAVPFQVDTTSNPNHFKLDLGVRIGAVSADDRLYRVSYSSDELWVCSLDDLASGSSPVNASAVDIRPLINLPASRLGLTGVSWSAAQDAVFVALDGPDARAQIWKLPVDPATGALMNGTLFADLGADPEFRVVAPQQFETAGLAVDPNTDMVYIGSGQRNRIYPIGPAGHIGAPFTSAPVWIDVQTGSYAFGFEAVPGPGPAVLLGIGVIGAAARRRRGAAKL